MFLDFLLEVFEANREKEAIVWRKGSVSYGRLLDRFHETLDQVDRDNVAPGTVALLEADYSPSAVAALLALIERGCIVVPLTPAAEAKKPEFAAIAQVEVSYTVGSEDAISLRRIPQRADHPLYDALRARRHPGLVLFSSGSTGESKGAVHDLAGLLEKFKTRRHDLRTLAFLLFDHIGGIDTLLYSLSNGSCLVIGDSRAPEEICRQVERHRVEVLPASPTFFRLLLLSEAYKRHDLSSLRYVTYGTEVMSESTLKRLAEILPGVNILQKYGTTEVGTLRSKSRRPDSVWVKIGGEGFQTRVVDGILQIKARSAMLGYLNAPSPFTADGWFNTGDAVEVDGEYLRILGRHSEIINVGGQKVYPAEVEDAILELPEVAEVTVYGESNAILGSIVCARLRVADALEEKEMVRRVKRYCSQRIEAYKVPVRMEISTARQHSGRYKKIRKS